MQATAELRGVTTTNAEIHAPPTLQLTTSGIFRIITENRPKNEAGYN